MHMCIYLYPASLLELTLIDSANPITPPQIVKLAMEPTFG